MANSQISTFKLQGRRGDAAKVTGDAVGEGVEVRGNTFSFPAPGRCLEMVLQMSEFAQALEEVRKSPGI